MNREQIDRAMANYRDAKKYGLLCLILVLVHSIFNAQLLMSGVTPEIKKLSLCVYFPFDVIATILIGLLFVWIWWRKKVLLRDMKNQA
jgi:hypothetical protein